MLRLFSICALSFVFIVTGCERPQSKPRKSSESKSSAYEFKIKRVELGPIQSKLVEDGKKIFDSKCAACHKMDERYVGPSLGGVTERRTPEWIMNMILTPEKMVQEDKTAKALLGEYMTPMANQNLQEQEARALLEYLRWLDSAKNPGDSGQTN